MIRYNVPGEEWSMTLMPMGLVTRKIQSNGLRVHKYFADAYTPYGIAQSPIYQLGGPKSLNRAIEVTVMLNSDPEADYSFRVKFSKFDGKDIVDIDHCPYEPRHPTYHRRDNSNSNRNSKNNSFNASAVFQIISNPCAFNDVCPICLRRGERSDVWIKPPCEHSFHKGCLERWLQSHNDCPICREKTSKDLCSRCDGPTQRQYNAMPINVQPQPQASVSGGAIWKRVSSPKKKVPLKRKVASPKRKAVSPKPASPKRKVAIRRKKML